ncbi:hypothetical protein P8452_28047 [Trifolium repens]|nr:hypothetical protein P8452_28047 [Trifolium repens]
MCQSSTIIILVHQYHQSYLLSAADCICPKHKIWLEDYKDPQVITGSHSHDHTIKIWDLRNGANIPLYMVVVQLRLIVCSIAMEAAVDT